MKNYLHLLSLTLTTLLINMIRRLFATFADHQILPTDLLPSSNTSSVGCNKFKSSTLESLNWLHGVAPCFPVSGDRVQVILEPNDFYETLIDRCKSARHRISMASLYLGIGNLENALVATLQKNLKENSHLSVNMLLDFTRGTRGIINSKSMLMPLIEANTNFKLSLYHTPALRGIVKKLAPPRWNELLGLQHMKVYLMDDTVIISGANLSNDYFTNRQDRYVIIEDKGLADFYSEFLTKVQEISMLVKADEQIVLHPQGKYLPYVGVKSDYVAMAQQNIRDFFEKTFHKQKDAVQNNKDADTWIFPLIEMGQLGIHHDSLVTRSLLSSSLENSKLKLASGYFNLTDSYMNTIIKDCSASCDILMAHPNANGFQGAKGMAGGIPAAYSLIAKRFYQNLVENDQVNRVKLFEYERLNWSYHAKGLWYYLPESTLPNATLIGSSNFGERSVNRDLESQVCLVTTNKGLQRRLQSEVDHLYRLGEAAEMTLMQRPIPKWVRAMVGLFKNYF